MGTAQTAIQARIDAQERYDTLVYGQRALAWTTTRWDRQGEAGTDWRWAQISAAQDTAAEMGITGAAGLAIKDAKRKAQDELAAAKATVKAIGTARQLRLALTTDGAAELAVAA